MVSFVCNGDAPLLWQLIKRLLHLLLLPSCSLISQQKSIGFHELIVVAGPGLQDESQPQCRPLPLVEDRGSVAENDEAIKPSLLAKPLKTQQCPQGLASPWSGEHQNIWIAIQQHPAPQQCDQLLLPLTRLDGWAVPPHRQGKAQGMNENPAQDESF